MPAEVVMTLGSCGETSESHAAWVHGLVSALSAAIAVLALVQAATETTIALWHLASVRTHLRRERAG